LLLCGFSSPPHPHLLAATSQSVKNQQQDFSALENIRKCHCVDEYREKKLKKKKIEDNGEEA
jgi:hypothetical protein